MNANSNGSVTPVKNEDKPDASNKPSYNLFIFRFSSVIHS